MTGLTREQAAKAVGVLFGSIPYYIGTYYGTWGVKDPQGKEWKFTFDGSINAERRRNGRWVSADFEYKTGIFAGWVRPFAGIGKSEFAVRDVGRFP